MIAHRLTALRQNKDVIIICDRYTWRLAARHLGPAR